MAISSVSRVYDAPDPILETDLELLAKVNTYQQGKFDAGAEAFQNEVNNWSLMTQIAKPELRDYANKKLNNLVNGINSLGGVNLSDINNVNSLKALGYNIYGDARITDGVITTQKMKALQANSAAKLSGKDAAKYDPTVAEYLMKGYNEWASDGNVDNAKYDGPVDLPMGNMATVNEKVRNYLKELKPDSDSAPSGDMQKSYGYFQVEGKWLKGDRINEAINAVIDQNDALIFRSHGWRGLADNNDKMLKDKLNVVYDNTKAGIDDQLKYLNAELNQTTDAGRKLEISRLITQQKQALSENELERTGWNSKQELSPAEREGIQESLFMNAWKYNVSNSYAYKQQKTELKTNMPLIFHDRIQQQAYQWSKDYDLRVADYELRKQKLGWEMTKDDYLKSLSGQFGPYGLPKTQVANTGETNQEKNPAPFMDAINANYFKANTAYYQYIYNLMGQNDTSNRFYKNDQGMWKPNPEYKDQVDQEAALFSSKLDNYSNLTDDEKKSLNLPTDQNELQQIFKSREQINTLKTFKDMAENKETEIINNAIATGKIDFDWRKVGLNIGSDFRRTTVGEALALYEAGVYNDQTDISGLEARPGSSTPYDLNISSFKTLKKSVDGLRDDAEKSYVKEGGKIFNSYNVPIPFTRLPKLTQEVMRNQLVNKIDLGAAGVESITPINGQIEYDFKTGQPKYLMNIQVGSDNKTRKQVQVDVSDMVKSEPYAGVGVFFDKSDFKMIWGLKLAQDGSTPFSKSSNYQGSLRTNAYSGNYPYQVVSASNPLNGDEGFKVKVALPVGNGNTVEVNVKNPQNAASTLFPASFEAVQQYLDDALSTPELKALFYQRHGLTLNQ